MSIVKIKDKSFKISITEAEIKERVKAVAQQISKDMEGKNPLLLGVLNGAFMFAADLYRAIDMPLSEITFIRYKSYDGTQSSGKVKKIMGLIENVEGREVIIIEDIVDTGHTAKMLRDDIAAFNPKSVKMASLLFKPESLKVGQAPEYTAFEIPPKFILGYGLDLDELARGMDEIYVLKNKD